MTELESLWAAYEKARQAYDVAKLNHRLACQSTQDTSLLFLEARDKFKVMTDAWEAWADVKTPGWRDQIKDRRNARLDK